MSCKIARRCVAAVAKPVFAQPASCKRLEAEPLGNSCRQLAKTALRGDYFASEKVVVEMRDAGLELTPQAFHGLIFSAAKAGELIVALEALQLAEKLGARGKRLAIAAIQPIPSAQ